MSTISVSNRCGETLYVSIDQWGNDGDTGTFQIANGGSESWGRDDCRGFLMYVQKTSASDACDGLAYYVTTGSSVVIGGASDNLEVEEDGRHLAPVNV